MHNLKTLHAEIKDLQKDIAGKLAGEQGYLTGSHVGLLNFDIQVGELDIHGQMVLRVLMYVEWH